jgi:hypothetical protein
MRRWVRELGFVAAHVGVKQVAGLVLGAGEQVAVTVEGAPDVGVSER